MCFSIEKKVCLKCKFINLHCVIDFLVKLTLNSSKYFRKHAQIRDSFVVKFSSHRLKILVEFKRAHKAGISEFHLSTETFGFSNKFFKKKLMCVLFCSSVFIHNSRSGNSRKTTASAPAVCRRISVDIAGFPQTDFDTKLVNFFLKLVLPVILKELQSNFLIST